MPADKSAAERAHEAISHAKEYHVLQHGEHGCRCGLGARIENLHAALDEACRERARHPCFCCSEGGCHHPDCGCAVTELEAQMPKPDEGIPEEVSGALDTLLNEGLCAGDICENRQALILAIRRSILEARIEEHELTCLDECGRILELKAELAALKEGK